MLMRNITKHAMRLYSVAINVDNYLEILAFYISVASMTFWYGSVPPTHGSGSIFLFRMPTNIIILKKFQLIIFGRYFKDKKSYKSHKNSINQGFSCFA
jgi:hypothetical protein